MRKVFRIWKFVESLHKDGWDTELRDALKLGWPMQCEGKTMEETDFLLNDDWMVSENAE